jgi:hypothetical protein
MIWFLVLLSAVCTLAEVIRFNDNSFCAHLDGSDIVSSTSWFRRANCTPINAQKIESKAESLVKKANEEKRKVMELT